MVGDGQVERPQTPIRSHGGAAYRTSGYDMQYDDFEMGGGMRKMGEYYCVYGMRVCGREQRGLIVEL